MSKPTAEETLTALPPPRNVDIGAWRLESVTLVEGNPDVAVRVVVRKDIGIKEPISVGLHRDHRGRMHGPYGFFAAEGGELPLLHRVLDRMLLEHAAVPGPASGRRQRPTKAQRGAHIRE